MSALFGVDWTSTDGLSTVTIRARAGEGWWPASVSIEADFGSTIQPEEAEVLADYIRLAAASAHRWHRRQRTEPREVAEPEKCPHCKGFGIIGGYHDSRECNRCKGLGYDEVERRKSIKPREVAEPW